MTQTQENNVPALRFPEFSGEWVKERLGTGIELISGQHLSPNEYSKVAGETPYFTGPSDFTNEAGQLTKWTTVASKNAHFGDVLITVKGSGVGELWYLELPIVAMGRQLMAIKGKTLRSDLVFQFLSTQRNYLAALAAGNMIPGLARNDLLKIKVRLPLDPEEQQKIAAFLSSVDCKIAQLGQKKALLQRYKKGMMQQLFSQELRFKDAQDHDFPDWKEKRLGEVVSIRKGQQLNRDDMIEHGVFPVINGGQAPSGYTNVSNSRKGVITISEGGNSCGFVAWQEFEFWLGGHCYSLKLESKEDNEQFLFQELKSIQPLIMRLRVGSGLPNIQKKDLLKLKVFMPPRPEQQKIADFLSSIDRKIDLVSAELDHAKTFKKGLLQQMFI